jgi:hypothetical protein
VLITLKTLQDSITWKLDTIRMTLTSNRATALKFQCNNRKTLLGSRIIIAVGLSEDLLLNLLPRKSDSNLILAASVLVSEREQLPF